MDENLQNTVAQRVIVRGVVGGQVIRALVPDGQLYAAAVGVIGIGPDLRTPPRAARRLNLGQVSSSLEMNR